MPGTVEFWEYLSPMLVTVTGSPGLCIITIHSVTGRLDFDNATIMWEVPLQRDWRRHHHGKEETPQPEAGNEHGVTAWGTSPTKTLISLVFLLGR